MKYLIGIFFCLTIIACNQSGPAPAAADLNGFTIENVPGTDYKKAVRLGTDGELREEGTLKDGKKNGLWIMYHDNSKENRIKSLTNYVDDRKTGVHLEFNTRGQIELKANYVNDVFNGMVAKYKFGRPTEEIGYKDGEYHGVFRTYYQRGAVQQEVNFKNGKQDGKFRYFDEDGNVTLEYDYKNGKKLSGGIIEK